jgi:H+/gluconate symporter-like permease
MDVLVVLLSLGFLMLAAYRGFSVILCAPIAALGAVMLIDPALVPPMFSGVFMNKMVAFLGNYFPVFLLSAVFGKLVEISGSSRAIVATVIRRTGSERAVLAIVLVSAILTYGGVSVFVVVFAVYPFAANLFRDANIPKRLIPATIALGAFTFTMDALPGTPQIQNIIPSTFFRTTAWAAPWLGTVGSVFILLAGMAYLEWRRRAAAAAGEGYGIEHRNEPEETPAGTLPHPLVALLPLVVVIVFNKFFAGLIAVRYDDSYTMQLAGMAKPVTVEVPPLVAVWSVEGALILGILLVVALGWRNIRSRLAQGSQAAVAGSMLAAMNTASEYGFGAVIASLPGFVVVAEMLRSIPNPLINEAITVTTLAGITGSASGGLSIALALMADTFLVQAAAAGIPTEVLHRVASMASGGMDTLPHNGAVITLLMVSGLTHRQAYLDIFAITVLKTIAVLVVIGVFLATGLV